MITLIVGGSKSGKSKYAEDVVCKYAIDNHLKKYYIATMIPFDEEDNKRIANHRLNRSGKNFITLERPNHIELINNNDGIYLIDSLTAYLLNKMLDESNINKTINELLNELTREFDIFLNNHDNVVMVGDYIFSNIESINNTFTDFTNKYLELLGLFLQHLAKKSDNVIEVKMGIPNVLVGEEYGKEEK